MSETDVRAFDREHLDGPPPSSRWMTGWLRASCSFSPMARSRLTSAEAFYRHLGAESKPGFRLRTSDM
jgi:hypothetical protein